MSQPKAIILDRPYLDHPALELLQTITLALIQGITEFLPISSSAHLILVAELTSWPDQGLMFDIAVHFGTLLALLAYYRRDCWSLGRSAWGFVRSGYRDAQLNLLVKIALASVPGALAGLCLQDFVANELRSSLVIASATLAFGLALWWADGRAGQREAPNFRDALLIGLAQTMALVPGTSRSGVTITAALLLGLSHAAAIRFAFLLAIPTIAGASLFAVLNLPAETSAALAQLALGVGVAALSAYLCISLFVGLMARIGLMPYVYYRLALGAVLLLMALR